MVEVTSIWNQVVGHNDLKLRFEDILSQNRLPQTMIFAGPRGVGKNLFAWGLAQKLLCEGQTCGVCPVCQRIEKRQHESVLAIDGDGGSIKVEQARQVREWTALARLSRARLVIFDPADWMNVQAANALLKLLEEPPEATYFILISNAPHSLPTTVRSRAQVFRFAHLRNAEIKQVLTNLNISDQSTDERFFAYARGSVERAQLWLNSGEQTQAVLDCIEDFLSASRQGLAFPQVQALKDLLGERDTQVLASAWFLTRVKEELLRGVSSVEFDEVASRICSLESDLNRGFDKALLLEKLSLDLHQSFSSL